jgi:hypothetical protein
MRHVSPPNTARSAAASGASSQNGTSAGIATFNGRNRLAPSAISKAARTIAGQRALAQPRPVTHRRTMAAASAISAKPI